MWQDDIDQWRVQHAKALAQLTQMIGQHGNALNTHADALDQITDSLKFQKRF